MEIYTHLVDFKNHYGKYDENVVARCGETIKRSKFDYAISNWAGEDDLFLDRLEKFSTTRPILFDGLQFYCELKDCEQIECEICRAIFVCSYIIRKQTVKAEPPPKKVDNSTSAHASELMKSFVKLIVGW
jgi:hypothetical protein